MSENVPHLCVCRLTGLSPFMGDNDKETLLNIAKCNWDFNDPSFDHISQEVSNFPINDYKKDRVHHPATMDVGRNIRDDE